MSLLINANSIKVNVDTIEGSISGMEFHLADSNRVVIFGHSRDKLAEYVNRIFINGKYKLHKLAYRAFNRDTLKFEGSIYACKYGQNVFTSSSVINACRIAITRVIKHAKLHVDKDLCERWMEGDVELSRVDLAVNFRLRSKEDVENVLKQIRRQLIEQHGPTHTNQSSVCWSPQDGKLYSIVLYNKGSQVQAAKRSQDEVPEFWEKLEKEAENILRIELRLRSGELQKLNLSRARQWKQNTAAAVFAKYLERLKLFNVTTGGLDKTEFDEYPQRLRPVLALHKLGADLDQIYSGRTCQRHRHEFRKRKIDLRCPNQVSAESIKLLDYLTSDKIITKVPQWMIDEGIAIDESVPDKKVSAK